MAAPAADVLYEEQQSFRQPWLWALMLVVFLFVAGSFWFSFDRLPQRKEQLIVPAAITLGLQVGVAVLLYALKLSVRLDTGHLHVRFAPLVKRDISLDEIAHWEVRTYKPIREYGGWGVRYSWKGTAYNVSGNRGVQLTLANGKRLLIGSQRPEEFAAALAQAKDQGQENKES